MRLCAINTYTDDKKYRINEQFSLIKKIVETNQCNNLVIKDNNFRYIDLNLYDIVVTSGDLKIIDPETRQRFYRVIKSHKIQQLVRDVTYIRDIPKITKLEANNFPRFTWNSSVINNDNFPYDPSYNRWLELSKKYNLTIKDYKKDGDKILFILQIPADTSLNELNFNSDGYINFVIRSVKKILENTDREIILRGHPLDVNQEKVLPHILSIYKSTKRVFKSNNKSLHDDFKDSKCVISYNSSSTVEALINGVKVINLSKNQPCFDAASDKIEDIENLKELDRENFCKKISFLHWENKEFQSKDFRLYFAKLIEQSLKRIKKN